MSGQLEQMYSYGDKETHLVELYGSGLALCGHNPYLGNWYGTELDNANKPLCKECEKLNGQ